MQWPCNPDSILHPFICVTLVHLISLTDVKAVSHTSIIYSRNKRYQQNHFFLKDIMQDCSFMESLKLFFVTTKRKDKKAV